MSDFAKNLAEQAALRKARSDARWSGPLRALVDSTRAPDQVVGSRLRMKSQVQHGVDSGDLHTGDVDARRHLANVTDRWFKESPLRAPSLSLDEVRDFVRMPVSDQRAAVRKDPSLYFRLPQEEITAETLDGAFMAAGNVRKLQESQHSRFMHWSDYLHHVVSWAPRELHTGRMLCQAVAGNRDWRRSLAERPESIATISMFRDLVRHHPLATPELAFNLVGAAPMLLGHLPQSMVTPEVIDLAKSVVDARQLNVDVDALIKQTDGPNKAVFFSPPSPKGARP